MVREVTPGEVKDKLDDDETQVVDIRSQAQYERGHIPGAINIPLADLPRQIDQVEWGDEIVVACPIGQSSIQAARLIQSFEGVDADATVASMEGGYDAWEYELERNESRDEIES